MEYDALNLDEDAKDDPNHQRRLSLQPQDLPIFTFWQRKCGDCCNCCKKKEESNNARMISNVETTLLLSDQQQISHSETAHRNETAKEKLVAEQCLDKTVNKIVNNLSWVNATLLAVAMKNTCEIDFPNAPSDKHAHANNAWIYFFIIFTLGIILAVIPRAFEDLDEMKRELELQSNEKKILMGDPNALAELEKKKQEKAEKEKHLDRKEKVKKVYDFVEVEANSLVEKFEDLFVDTLSNTVSMAWRDAAKATFALIISTDSATATAYFFYALFLTVLGIYLVIRIEGVYEYKEVAIQEYLETFDDRFDTTSDEKKKLLGFAFIKRSIKLSTTVIKFAIAWSWRDCINAFMRAIYGDSGGDLVAQKWGYFLTIACFVSVAYSFSDQFYILYPKNVSKEEQEAFLKDKSRISVNNLLYDNFKFVVGMALFDALMTSLRSLSYSDDVPNGLLCLLYWIVAVTGISSSVIGIHYLKKWDLQNKISDQGLAQAMFDTFERFYDPLQSLHKEGDSDFVPMILDTTVYELLFVTVDGLGLAGSMGVTNAIKFTINSMTSGSGLYDISDPDEMAGGVWIVWLSFFICLAVSTLITGYFVRAIDTMKDTRKILFKKYRKDDEEKIDQHDDYKQEEKIDQYDDDNTRKRNKFSTKAADEGYLGDIGGGDDGGDNGGGGDAGGGDDGGGDVGGDAGDAGGADAGGGGN